MRVAAITNCRVAVVTSMLCLAYLAIPTRVAAQRMVYGDTIVEVLGLKDWTLKQVEAAVRKYAPDLSLASGACAVILRDSVGFAEAAVHHVSFAGNDTLWTTISVLEPTDSALVRYTRMQRTPLASPEGWAALDSAFAAQPRMITYFQHPQFLLDGADSVFGRAVPQEAHTLRARLRALDAEEDRRAALGILRHSSDGRARQLAALVVTNFADDPDTWHALVEALRAASDFGASAAQMVLSAMGRTGRYTIDWEPARESLEAIMGGTNLFAYGPLQAALVDTRIHQDLAKALTAVNPHLLADYAVASNLVVRGPARRFLTHAGAPDYGHDRAAWFAWMTR